MAFPSNFGDIMVILKNPIISFFNRMVFGGLSVNILRMPRSCSGEHLVLLLKLNQFNANNSSFEIALITIPRTVFHLVDVTKYMYRASQKKSHVDSSDMKGP